jgi:hypothetical protein
LRVELSQFTQLDTLKCKIAVNFTPKSIWGWIKVLLREIKVGLRFSLKFYTRVDVIVIIFFTENYLSTLKFEKLKSFNDFSLIYKNFNPHLQMDSQKNLFSIKTL